MSDLTQFRTRFPEFADVADPRVEMFLDDAALQVHQPVWGKFYDQGVLYLAAHLLSIAGREEEGEGEGADGAGPVYSDTVGPLNYKRAVTPVSVEGGEALLSSTSYGLRYIELRSLIPNVGYLVTSDAQYSDSDLR